MSNGSPTKSLLIKALTLCGQHCLASLPDKQAHAKFLIQRLYLPVNGRMGQAELSAALR